MRASGPLPVPGHLTPALLLPAVQLSTTALSCSCELLPAPPAPAPPDRETPCSLFLSGSHHFVHLCHSTHIWKIFVSHNCSGKIIKAKLPPFTNCSISAPSSSAASTLLLQPFHPSPSAAITPNHLQLPSPLATLLATCQPTLSGTKPSGCQGPM